MNQSGITGRDQKAAPENQVTQTKPQVGLFLYQ